MSGDILDWSEPPPPGAPWGQGSKPGRRKTFVAQLQERPGQWAEYLPKTGQVGWSSGTSTTMHNDYPGVETIARTAGHDRDGKAYYRIWARWVGPEAEPPKGRRR